jgi:type I restriction enzyme S subunit
MKFKGYADYQDHGVAWAPVIPSHWGRASLRWLADIYAGGTPDKENRAFWTDGSVPWLNSGAVNDWAITKPSQWISEAALAGSSARWIPAQSVVIGLAGQGKTKGTSARLEFRATCNQSMAAIVPRERLNYRFLHYWLVANYQSIRNLAGGDKRDGLNLRHISSIECPLPPMSDQQDIADYLDYETAKINTLIQEQQQLVAILRERREVVTDFALTGGVESESGDYTGYPWIGRIPRGWSCRPLRHCVGTPITDGPHETPEFVSSQKGVPFLSAEGVSSGRIRFEKVRGYISRQDHERFATKYLPQWGDIFIVKSGATTGTAAIVDSDIEFNIWSPLAAIRPNHDFFPRYLYHFVNGRAFQRSIALHWNYGTQQNIGMGVLSTLPVVVPPIADQRRIAAYLDGQLGQIDELISSAVQFSDLVRERWTALVSAAVSGQIDVRGEVA